MKTRIESKKRILTLSMSLVAAVVFLIIVAVNPTDSRVKKQEKGADSVSVPYESGSVVRAENIRLVNVRKLTRGAYPKWSPDGKWIAFGTMRAGLFIVKANGTDTPKQIGSPYASASSAKWSWDGRELFYFKIEPIKRPPYIEYFTESVSVVTGRIRPRPDLNEYNGYTLDSVAKVRGAGSPILYDYYTEKVDHTLSFVKAKTYDGSRNWLITPQKANYSGYILSPDGKTVLIQEQGAMFIYATDGSGLLVSLGRGSMNSWSPDGKKVLYDFGKDDGHRTLISELFIVNADGTGHKQLTFTPDIHEADADWSPDGKRITFWGFESETVYIADIATED